MLVSDKQTRPWIIISTILLLTGAAVYGFYRARVANGPSGSTVVGLVYGSLSLAMMFFAMLLALRKRWRNLRIGRTYFWMQGHVWLGLLSYPFAFFHSGFRFGMPFGLTWVIMALFTVVIASGIVGLVLQQIIPKMILKNVRRETVYEQHDHVLGILRREVDDRVAVVEKELQAPTGGAEAGVMDAVHTDIGTVVALDRVRAFRESYVTPFLELTAPRLSPLRTHASSARLFKELYAVVPAKLAEPINDIEEIVEERRQMILHRSLHRWLHLWLIVHVPLSYVLFVLTVIHVVYALRFV